MRVYNSLTFQKEEFKTINPKEVLMYVCGPTVYDSPHLGHAKSAVAFDVIRRYLEFKKFDVKIVKNYTDIDDKIIKRAKEKDMDFLELSNQYIEDYENSMQILNIKKETFNPRATETIDFMIEFIRKLISKGHAYESNGSVYFAVKTYPNYNTIFQNVKADEDNLEDILEEEESLYGDKYDLKDFVLWKKWKEGEPYWESPWGKGRPGWHIECSAMAIKYLGETIDIHGGGQDLKSPHHKNEIAQAETYTGKKFANYFLHNGFVNVDNEKMSKSLGNFFLVSDVIKKFDPMVVRFFLLSSHYRSSINYTLENMKQAEANYNKLLNTIKMVGKKESISKESEEMEAVIENLKVKEEKILRAMDDDFDTPVALAELMTLFREINKAFLEKKIAITESFKDQFFQFLERIDKIFGIFPDLQKELSSEFEERGELVKDLLDIIKEIRNELRKKKEYNLSDYIREKLRDLGIKIEDK